MQVVERYQAKVPTLPELDKFLTAFFKVPNGRFFRVYWGPNMHKGEVYLKLDAASVFCTTSNTLVSVSDWTRECYLKILDDVVLVTNE